MHDDSHTVGWFPCKVCRYRQRLRIYRRPGSVLVDYRILRNFVRIYQFTGFTQ
ncbi:YlcG family protein [Salmonella enterica]|nr:YlcG family protein [Salmonella enterica]